MKTAHSAARVTLWVNRAVTLVLGVLTFTMPALLDWFQTFRPLGAYGEPAILIGFYGCVPLAGIALWKLELLMRNILRDAVFVHENVSGIRTIRWCCLGVSLICLPPAFFYPPLIFMVVIMGFLSLVVNVVCQVMKAAVAIREENDLTV